MNAILSSLSATSDRPGPLLGIRYWIGISMASVLGADVGDFISRNLHMGHWRGVLPLALLFWAVLHARRRRWIGYELGYWVGVIIVRAGATNLADLVDHELDWNIYVLVVALFAGCVISARLRNKGANEESSISGLPDTTGTYWLTLFLAGAFGTVAGDEMSDRLGLLGATLSLSCIFVGLLLLRKTRPMRGKNGYWSMILAARTAGTSAGDFIADKTFLGLAGSTSAIGLLMLATLWLWPREQAARPL